MVKATILIRNYYFSLNCYFSDILVEDFLSFSTI